MKSKSMEKNKNWIVGASSKQLWAWPRTNNYTYAIPYSVFMSVCVCVDGKNLNSTGANSCGDGSKRNSLFNQNWFI